MQEQRCATVNTVAASVLVAFFKAPELAALDFKWCSISTMVPLLNVEDSTALCNPSEGKLLIFAGTGGHLEGVSVGSAVTETFGTCVNIEKGYTYVTTTLKTQSCSSYLSVMS